jgi:hypothetical protein
MTDGTAVSGTPGSYSSSYNTNTSGFVNGFAGTVHSGTWRCMAYAYGTGPSGFPSIWVRIS